VLLLLTSHWLLLLHLHPLGQDRGAKLIVKVLLGQYSVRITVKEQSLAGRQVWFGPAGYRLERGMLSCHLINRFK
jgi:hypothetical protein